MKASEVRKLLRISQQTLRRWAKQGLIRTRQLPNGHYEYVDEDVYRLLAQYRGQTNIRETVIYARVSSSSRKADLDNQVKTCVEFARARGWQIHGVYKDVASALDFDRREDFQVLVNRILNYEIERVIITYKDRLTRIGFDFFKKLFGQYGTEIVVVSDYNPDHNDLDELVEELVTVLHSFAMKHYANRNKLKKCLQAK